MPYERTGYAPWSLAREAGVQSATVDSEIQVPQYLQPIVDTGIVDEKGDWKGIKSSDEQFDFYHRGNAIPNGEVDLASTCDMTGFNDIQLAIRPTNGGNFAIAAVMGPDTNSYANLSPVNAAAPLKGNYPGISSNIEELLNDAAESLTADVWNIFYFNNMLENQKLLQFKVVNNSGGSSDIETAFMRIV